MYVLYQKIFGKHVFFCACRLTCQSMYKGMVLMKN